MASTVRLITVFLLIAFGLAWLTALPLWLGEGISSPLLPIVAIAMMATPAIAAIIVVFFVERPAHKAEALGIRPLGPTPRFLGFLGLALVVPVALILAALLVGSLFGVYTADLVTFSAFRETLEAQLPDGGVDALGIPLGALVAAQFLNVAIGALINTIPALGEEIGWRGWLLPKLIPLGAVPAIIISGIIWGAWHAPLILLGYNYPGVPGWLGVLLMIGMCTVIGAVFGWLRLRSGSVWPAALAHGSFNAAAGFSLIFAAADPPIDTAHATILGWSGWLVPAVLVIVLVATGQFRSRPQTALVA
jgi:membrane protease YdiL (CAAX protease family)